MKGFESRMEPFIFRGRSAGLHCACPETEQGDTLARLTFCLCKKLILRLSTPRPRYTSRPCVIQVPVRLKASSKCPEAFARRQRVALDLMHDVAGLVLSEIRVQELQTFPDVKTAEMNMPSRLAPFVFSSEAHPLHPCPSRQSLSSHHEPEPHHGLRRCHGCRGWWLPAGLDVRDAHGSGRPQC